MTALSSSPTESCPNSSTAKAMKVHSIRLQLRNGSFIIKTREAMPRIFYTSCCNKPTYVLAASDVMSVTCDDSPVRKARAENGGKDHAETAPHAETH